MKSGNWDRLQFSLQIKLNNYFVAATGRDLGRLRRLTHSLGYYSA